MNEIERLNRKAAFWGYVAAFALTMACVSQIIRLVIHFWGAV